MNLISKLTDVLTGTLSWANVCSHPSGLISSGSALLDCLYVLWQAWHMGRATSLCPHTAVWVYPMPNSDLPFYLFHTNHIAITVHPKCSRECRVFVFPIFLYNKPKKNQECHNLSCPFLLRKLGFHNPISLGALPFAIVLYIHQFPSQFRTYSTGR